MKLEKIDPNRLRLVMTSAEKVRQIRNIGVFIGLLQARGWKARPMEGREEYWVDFTK